MLRNLELGTDRGVVKAIRIVRTAFWFERLRRVTCKETPYRLGKYLQPDTYKKKNKDADKDRETTEAYHHNLWAKYAVGKHAPRPATLEAVEEIDPGSRAKFEHVVFELLDITKPIGKLGDHYLKQLHPGVQRAVFDNAALKLGIRRRRKALSHTLIWIERVGDLDAIAACIILLREAHEQGDQERAFAIGGSLYQTLLIACTCSDTRLIREELGLAALLLVLPLAESRGRGYDGGFKRFLDSCYFLNSTILRLEDNYQIGLVNTETRRGAWSVLHGKYGDDLRFGLMPRLALTVPRQDAPVQSRVEVHRSVFLGDWGRGIMSSYEVVQYIPVSVLVAMQDELDEIRYCQPTERAIGAAETSLAAARHPGLAAKLPSNSQPPVNQVPPRRHRANPHGAILPGQGESASSNRG